MNLGGININSGLQRCTMSMRARGSEMTPDANPPGSIGDTGTSGSPQPVSPNPSPLRPKRVPFVWPTWRKAPKPHYIHPKNNYPYPRPPLLECMMPFKSIFFVILQRWLFNPLQALGWPGYYDAYGKLPIHRRAEGYDGVNKYGTGYLLPGLRDSVMRNPYLLIFPTLDTGETVFHILARGGEQSELWDGYLKAGTLAEMLPKDFFHKILSAKDTLGNTMLNSVLATARHAKNEPMVKWLEGINGNQPRES